MEETSQVKGLNINHDGFLLSELTVLVSIKIEVAIFLEPFFRLSAVNMEGHVKENINLRRDFPVV